MSNDISTPLTGFSQEIQDVKDNLEALIPWVNKLKDTLTNAEAKDDPEEAERRRQLEKSASHLCYLSTLKLSPIGPWMTSSQSPKRC